MKLQIGRYQTQKEAMTVPAAVATMHKWLDKTRCSGTLHRTNCGADRLSERMGRIVVVCDVCKAKFSLSVSE